MRKSSEGKGRGEDSEEEMRKRKALETAQLAMRFNVVKELLSTEMNYLFSLATLIEVCSAYIQGIYKPMALHTTEAELRIVFSNLQEIRRHHQGLLKLIKARVDLWTTESLISDIFLQV